MITYDTWKEAIMPTFDESSDTKGALEVLQWTYDTYQQKVIYACSFGLEGMVLIECISRIQPDATIVFLDTNYHFQETYNLIEKVKKRYPTITIQCQQPACSIAEQEEQYGKNLYQSNPNQCCYLRKILPLQEALTPYVAWISGLRRDQSETRKQTNFINLDHRFQKIKICPLIHWTWDEVWDFVKLHDLPYNLLHDQGYPSIGCAPCTKAVTNTNDLRSGRWDGFGKTECGLHTP